MLYYVTCELMLDSKDQNEAMEKVREFLSGEIEIDYNFLVHMAEKAEDYKSLKALREKES